MTTLEGQLRRSAFRGDRLSLWLVHGLRWLDLDGGEQRGGAPSRAAAFYSDLLGVAAEFAAKGSVLLAEAPHLGAGEAGAFFGQYGFLGSAQDLATVGERYGRAGPAGGPGGGAVFAGVQQWRSAVEEDIYAQHVAAAEETDEDFFGNFS